MLLILISRSKHQEWERMEKNVLWLPVSISPHWNTIMYPGGNTSYICMTETVNRQNGSQNPKEQVSFNFMAAITICRDFGPRKINSATVSTVSPSIAYEVMGPDAMIFVFWMLSFKPTFSLSCFTFMKRLFTGYSQFSNEKVVRWCDSWSVSATVWKNEWFSISFSD